jgi:hypothetical protein
MRTDQQIIDDVNRLAAELFKAKNALELPSGFRCDQSHYRWHLDAWCEAVDTWKEQHGEDAQAALARKEAELRNPINAPELHIERRE